MSLTCLLLSLVTVTIESSNGNDNDNNSRFILLGTLNTKQTNYVCDIVNIYSM